jgi:hypothetical protein
MQTVAPTRSRSTHSSVRALRSRERKDGQSSPVVNSLVRAGFVARAIVYGVIGALALAVAFGAVIRPASPNPQGALSLINGVPLGRPALVIIAAGLLAYALWKLAQALVGRGPEGGGGADVKQRLANLGGGILYLAFFAVAVAVLIGSTGNGSAQPRSTAGQVLSLPGGDVLLGIAGIALLAISIYQIYDAISGNFANDNKVEQMSLAHWRGFMLVGRVGLIVRALVFGVVAYFLLRAAIDLKAGNAVGLDGALAALHRQSFGSFLLAFAAAGLLTFAVFSLLEARYRRL